MTEKGDDASRLEAASKELERIGMQNRIGALKEVAKP